MSQEKAPRRRFLRQVLAIVPAAAVATGTAVSQAGCVRQEAAAGAAYEPKYFTATEWRFLHAALDRLIPADELGPGALQARVPEFVDRQMELPYGHGKLWYMQGPFHPGQPPEMGYQLSLTPREVYRHGIAACDGHCRKTFGKPFADLDHARQEQVLADMEHGKVELEAVPARTVFSQLLANAKEGFLSDPIHGGNHDMAGWKLVGFPGARADFADWIDQPNTRYPYGPVSISGKQG